MLENISHSDRGQLSTAELVAPFREMTRGVRYDTIIGIGISGAMVIPAMGRNLRKHWALIRKDGEYSHARGEHFEGRIGERFIVVDDFVSSGASVAVILVKVLRASYERLWNAENWPTFVGVWEYTFSRFTDAATISESKRSIRQANAALMNIETPESVMRPCGCGCGTMLDPS